jgi:hypothetical protein
MTNFNDQHVLIIDDDEGVAGTISKFLERMKINSDCCHNLGEGLMTLSEKQYDLIFPGCKSAGRGWHRSDPDYSGRRTPSPDYHNDRIY